MNCDIPLADGRAQIQVKTSLALKPRCIYNHYGEVLPPAGYILDLS
jgi:hypothetical protein